jgi:hypothetical protein
MILSGGIRWYKISLTNLVKLYLASGLVEFPCIVLTVLGCQIISPN